MIKIEYIQTTLDKVKELIDASKPIMYDSETIGFYGKIRLAQFFQEGWEKPVIVEYPNPMELVSLLTGLIVVAHNAHYDITTIQENLGKLKWHPKDFHCTFMLARLHFYTKDSFSLDNVISYVLGSRPYGHDKKDMQTSDWGTPVLSEEQKMYAALDVVCLLDVWNVVKDQLEDYNYKLDMLCIKYCLDFQNNGMPLDMDRLTAKYAENVAKIKEIALPINCNSYQQVRKYIDSNLSDDLGLSTLISQGNMKAKAVKDTRKLTKENSFLTKFTETAVDNVIYGKFKLSPRSGRTSSDDQNLQQIPRSLKEVFGVATDGDTVVIHTDFAQIQLRGACVVANDKKMEKLFRAGEDLHNYVAKLIFGAEFSKEDRQICKTGNFGLLFGAGVIVFLAILLKNTGIARSENWALGFIKNWKNLWSDILKWQKAGAKAWKKGQVGETPLGRRYTADRMTDYLAMEIQGFEAEVAKLAMHYMLPKLAVLHKDILLRNFIHDSYIFTCPKDETIYKEACLIISDSMQEAWKQMCQNVAITDLPMPVKVRVGYNWGDIEDDNFIYEHLAA